MSITENDHVIARDPRVDSIETRLAIQEASRVETAATVATLTEGQRMMREDMQDLIKEMRSTNASITEINDRVDKIAHEVMEDVDDKFNKIGKGFWAVVVLLVPVAVSLVIGLLASS